MIQSHPKTDRDKLSGLEKFLHRKFIGCNTTLEPFMSFTKGEDEYVGMNMDLTAEQVRNHDTHPPDIVLVYKGKRVVLELDGPIHDIKTFKTKQRNKRYELNNMLYVVVNETDLKYELKIAKSALLSQEQINQAFLEKIMNLSLWVPPRIESLSHHQVSKTYEPTGKDQSVK